MGCAASVGNIRGRWSSPSSVGPGPRILHMLPTDGAVAATSPVSTPTTAKTRVAPNKSKNNTCGRSSDTGGRRPTMKHTPKLDSEPAQRLQSYVLEMSKRGRLELTSSVARDDSSQDIGTLTKAELPVLEQIPGVVFGMTKLLELNLRCNQLSVIPKEIASLKALKVLVVAENRLSALPREIGELRELKTLDVAENQLQRLPDELGLLVRLKTLLANRNRITALPDTIRKCTRLRIVNLYNNALTILSDAVSEWSELEELNVSNNLLEELPADVSRWTHVRELYLQVNRLTELPSFDALSSLELLTVQQNVLTALPSMDALVALKKIDANTNQIRAIPPYVERLVSLTHLSLRKNLIEKLPVFLSRCRSLEILDVGNNPLIASVPAELATLSSLKTFLIDGTCVTAVPIELMGLQQVCRVNLGNCLQMSDLETCEVVTELRSRCAQNGGWLKTG